MSSRDTAKEIKDILRQRYGLIISNKQFDNYLYIFARNNHFYSMTIKEAMIVILDYPDCFAYMIIGLRAKEEYREYKANKD